MADSDEELPSQALFALQQGRMIEAIKILRQERGLGLKEAKDRLELYLRDHPTMQTQFASARAEGNRSGLFWLIPVIAAAVAAYFYFKGS
jgi:hypothetical protein